MGHWLGPDSAAGSTRIICTKVNLIQRDLGHQTGLPPGVSAFRRQHFSALRRRPIRIPTRPHFHPGKLALYVTQGHVVRSQVSMCWLWNLSFAGSSLLEGRSARLASPPLIAAVGECSFAAGHFVHRLGAGFIRAVRSWRRGFHGRQLTNNRPACARAPPSTQRTR